MKLRSRFTRFVVAFAASLSLLAGFVAAPSTNASAASVSSTGVTAAAGIGAKKKTLTTEQKNAKKALDTAVKDLKVKEKNLKAAVKAQVKTAKALAKATKATEAFPVRNVVGQSKKAKAKAKAAAKELKAAQAKDARAVSLVARRTVLRDTAQAKVIRLDAKYAWLIEDISTLQCGVGTQVTTASGAIETVRECGIVYMHEDGDTTHVKTTTNKMIEIRNIGLQTPERRKGTNPAQCGAEDAYQNFKALMPEQITIVQLRSVTNSTNGWGGGSRPLRSVYKLNNATGAFDIDVQAEQIKAGWSLWWPQASEWAQNKEYLDLMNDAKSRGVGLWNPNLCGAATGAVPLMWFSQNAPTIDTDTEPAFGEYVILKNDTDSVMNLTDWMLRDSSLNFFWDSENGNWMQRQNKFGSFTIPARGHRIVYIDNPRGYELSATEYEYFNWSRNAPGHQLTNGSISGNYANGDGLYLQDPKGNIRVSMNNPCTSAAMCATPAWVTEIISSTRAGQIIPIPVALNKVRNDYIHPSIASLNVPGRDTYNPKVVIVSGVGKFVSAYNSDRTDKTYVNLSAKYIVSPGAAIDSPRVAGTLVDLSLSPTGPSVLGTRVPIADALGRTQTTIYTRIATGNNTVPTLTGMTDAAARAALTAAGFTVGTVTQTAVAGTSGVVSQVETGVKAVGSAVSFTINTPPVVP